MDFRLFQATAPKKDEFPEKNVKVNLRLSWDGTNEIRLVNKKALYLRIILSYGNNIRR
jgi:hypothetical protein